MKGNGNLVKCMGRENSAGPTNLPIKVIIFSGGNMEEAALSFLRVTIMKGFGSTVSKMEKGYFTTVIRTN